MQSVNTQLNFWLVHNMIGKCMQFIEIYEIGVNGKNSLWSRVKKRSIFTTLSVRKKLYFPFHYFIECFARRNAQIHSIVKMFAGSNLSIDRNHLVFFYGLKSIICHQPDWKICYCHSLSILFCWLYSDRVCKKPMKSRNKKRAFFLQIHEWKEMSQKICDPIDVDSALCAMRAGKR